VFGENQLPGVPVRAAQLLARIGKPALPPLLQALKDPNSGMRIGASSSLGAMGGEAKSAIPHLENALSVETDKAAREEEEAVLRRIQAAPDPK
jgi:HEAT repeat protein